MATHINPPFRIIPEGGGDPLLPSIGDIFEYQQSDGSLVAWRRDRMLNFQVQSENSFGPVGPVGVVLLPGVDPESFCTLLRLTTGRGVRHEEPRDGVHCFTLV